MQKDRRLFPRHNLIFSVEVQLDHQQDQPQDNQLFSTESSNISQKALEVSCDELIINAMLAKKNYPHTCRLRFQLPEDQYFFDIAAQVASHRRLSQHQFLLAFLFVDTENEWALALNKYFEKLRSAASDG